MVGSTIGSYEILDQLGAGGMGSVYLAKHTSLGQLAALKVLHPEYSVRADIVERFFNEARAASEIDHPAIVGIHDFGYSDENNAYIVMEYLQGESLDARLKQTQCLRLNEAVVLVRQIANALGAAHAKGIVHRDLKPENIFLTADPEVPGGERIRLLDFGIAKLTNSNIQASGTKTGAVMGTPTYMSPEQCTGAKNVDHRTDLYALGCILFQMICGRAPFIGNTATIMAAHMFEAPPAPSSMAVLPPDLEAIIYHLVDKRPEGRFQSAAELIAALDTLPDLSGYYLRAAAPRTGAMPHASSGSRPPSSPYMASSPSASSLTPAPGTPVPGSTPFVSPTTLGHAAGSYVGPQTSSARGRMWIALSAVAAGAAIVAAVMLLSNDPEEAKTAGGQTPHTQAAPAAESPTNPARSASAVPAAPATGEVKASEGSDQKNQITRIKIEIMSEPEGASIYREFDGALIGTTPYVYKAAANTGMLVFVLRLDGHGDKKLVASAGEDSSHWIELESQKPAQSEAAEVAPKKPRKPQTQKKKTKKKKKKPSDGALNPFD